MTDESQGCALNTDKTVWEAGYDYRDIRIHVTKEHAIGISVGGRTIVKSADAWHALSTTAWEEGFQYRAYLESVACQSDECESCVAGKCTAGLECVACSNPVLRSEPTGEQP